MPHGPGRRPHCLVTFANFPTTEYLAPRGVDLHCFNVYLHDARVVGDYLARLQHVVVQGKPLIVGESGVDAAQEQTEAGQAAALAGQVRAVLDEGLAGTTVFAFTDDFYHRAVSTVAAVLSGVEWHALAAAVAVLGLVAHRLLWAAAAMVAASPVLAVVAAVQTPLPPWPAWLTRPLVAYLHWRQPLARGRARLAVRVRRPA